MSMSIVYLLPWEKSICRWGLPCPLLSLQNLNKAWHRTGWTLMCTIKGFPDHEHYSRMVEYSFTYIMPWNRFFSI